METENQLQSDEVIGKPDDSNISSEKVSTNNVAESGTIKKSEEESKCHVCIHAKPFCKQAEGLENENKNSDQERYQCGVCSETFCTICRLHNHLTMYHLLNGSYQYDYFIRTAFPKYDSLCQFTQTEELYFNREEVLETASRKRYIDQTDGHELKGAIVSKSKVRKKVKVKKSSQISHACREGGYKVNDANNCLRTVKLEAGEVVKNEMTQDIASSDGYNTDRTDDYFDSQDDETSEMENKNHSADIFYHNNAESDSNRQNAKSQTDDKSKYKARGLNCIINISQNHKSNIKINTREPSGNSNKFKIKLHEKSSSVINTKQKLEKKSRLKKTKDRLNARKDVCNEYENKTNKVNNKVLLESDSVAKKENTVRNCMQSNKQSLEKYIKEKNQSDKKHVEKKIQSDAKHTERESKKVKEVMKSNRCEICGATFSVKQGLLRHEQLKHADQMNFKCEQCNKRFMRNFNLEKHIKHVHGGTKGSKVKVEPNHTDKGSVGSTSEEVSPVKLLAENTQETADSIENEEKQVDEHVEVKVRRKRRTNEEVKSLKTPHTCELCGHTMPKSKMDVHKRLHTGLLLCVFHFFV